MSMWGAKAKLTRTCEKVTEPTLPASAGEAEPKGSTACCEKPMNPRFGQARDRQGQVVFVAIWRCATCGRVTF